MLSMHVHLPDMFMRQFRCFEIDDDIGSLSCFLQQKNVQCSDHELTRPCADGTQLSGS